MKPEELKNEFRSLVAELKDSVTTENLEAVNKINERMDEIEFSVKSINTPAPSPEQKSSEVRNMFNEYGVKFATGNRHELAKAETKNGYHKSLEKKTANLVRFDFAGSGALLLPDELSNDIIKNAFEVTPIMQLASQRTTNAPNYKQRIRTSTPGGRWLAEEAQNTKGKPTYGTIDITPQKWAAQYGMTIENEQDSGFNLYDEIIDAFREDASIDLGKAFMQGDGVGKPTGLVGRITNFNATQLALSTNDLVRMQEEILEDYQANASWLFTRATRANIRTQVLSSTNGLAYTWEPNFQANTPTLLLGKPVYIAREGDLAGKVSGAFTAGQVYAVYGDFSRGYRVTRHTEMYMIDDPYTEANQFVRNFHIMARFGGNVLQPQALVQITAAGS
jgi:HK97 family phage major capsid protein